MESPYVRDPDDKLEPGQLVQVRPHMREDFSEQFGYATSHGPYRIKRRGKIILLV